MDNKDVEIEKLKAEVKRLKELLEDPIQYAKSRPQGERGWKTWLKKVEDSEKNAPQERT